MYRMQVLGLNKIRNSPKVESWDAVSSRIIVDLQLANDKDRFKRQLPRILLYTNHFGQ